MTLKFKTAYVSCGCNKVPHAADWGKNGLICFGSCNSVVIYNPAYAGEGGKITHTLHGHQDRVNSVRWFRNNFYTPENKVVSSSADGTAIVWLWCEKTETFVQDVVLKGHTNVLSVADGFSRTSNKPIFNEHSLVATSSIDSTVRIWKIAPNTSERLKCIDILKWSSGFCLDVKLDIFPSTDVVVLACAADDNKVHIFVEQKRSEIDGVDDDHQFYKIHVLSGHEDWVRSIDFYPHGSDLYLATASQDTYIRVYKFERKIEQHGKSNSYSKEVLEVEENIIKIGSTHNMHHYAVSLETVLAGHEGWVYGVSWHPELCTLPSETAMDKTPEMTDNPPNLKLLSSSMDKSLIVWAPDKSGIWSEEARVGEVGGNMLGFYGGKFGPQGQLIMGHGYQGSFHIWAYDEVSKNWEPKVVVGGHTAEVTDLAWDTNGNYCLSIGGDQTTRLHAPWVRSSTEEVTWHEIARPQIHGYDLSCLAMLSQYKFASGAEEKVIRAFTAPNNFVENFKRICDIKVDSKEVKAERLPQGASIPALGLSNKPVFEQMKKEGYLVDDEYPDLYFSPIHLTKPPTEENLMQNTLWPEAQKLYGHGYEIYSLAARHDGVVLASASKATVPEHAAIILWNAKTWLQIQKLVAHQLTVTQMSFSPNGKYLLSVSRDRKWCLFAVKEDGKLYELVATSDAKNNIHTRVIWCCCWTSDSSTFATGSRDGKIGIWYPYATQGTDRKVVVVNLVTSLELAKESITALAFAPVAKNDCHLLAVGLECGSISLFSFSDKILENINVVMGGNLGHSLTIKRLAFRPINGRTGLNRKGQSQNGVLQLASCGNDHIIKIFNLFWDEA
ncbi:hypothetical protein RUM44_006278 [Polyplax serrata]|uniref:Elongator complex protein 2 n=1 Tax=Polyplax serrata TaxID=468196 RepID=A0ABR1AHQ1_POLSC